MQPRGPLRTKSFKNMLVFLAHRQRTAPIFTAWSPRHLMQFGRFAQKPDPPEYTTTGLHSGVRCRKRRVGARKEDALQVDQHHLFQ